MLQLVFLVPQRLQVCKLPKPRVQLRRSAWLSTGTSDLNISDLGLLLSLLTRLLRDPLLCTKARSLLRAHNHSRLSARRHSRRHRARAIRMFK